MSKSMYINHEGIRMASGRMFGVDHINKFGFNPAVGSTEETIHDAGGIYSYITTAGTATVAGASDATAVIEIQGLDENFLPVTEDVAVGGTSTASFIRVFRARVKTPHTGTTNNIGNITITVDSAVRATILAGKGQTLMAVYTTPAGQEGYLLKFQGSIDKNQEAQFSIYAREIEVDGFNIKGQFGTFSNSITYDYPVPLKFTEKTDIEIRATAGAIAGLGAVFDIVLLS